MYYHSVEWGFDINYAKKKNEAMKFLIDNSFTTCISRICRIDNMRELFDGNKKYLVMVYPDFTFLKRTGFFDIINYDLLQDNIKKEYGENVNLEDFEYCCIEQMEKIDNCFTAVICSNGEGALIVEFLKDTIDNREITSDTESDRVPQRIVYDNFELMECDDYEVLKVLFSDINKCLWLKGYFELSFARVGKKKGVYYSYYSSEKIYMNIFNRKKDDLFGIRERCILNYLKHSGQIC